MTTCCIDSLRSLARVALCLCLVGCASTPEPGWQDALEVVIEDRAAEFEAAADILAGFDAVGAGDELAVGDQLLYGIRLDVGDRRQIWYLLLSVDAIEVRQAIQMRVVQPFEAAVTTARRKQRAVEAERQRRETGPIRGTLGEPFRDMPFARVRVAAFDESGASLGAAVSAESVQRLQTGVWPACIAGYAQRDRMRDWADAVRRGIVIEVDDATYADIDTVGEGVAACDGFFAILQKNSVTRSILYEVIALPSLWSILVNLGVEAGFDIDFFAADRVAAERVPNASGDVWSVPMTILLNEQPALLARILAAPAHGPAAAAAGVYGFVGRHPTDPSRRVHAQLLASRRGVLR